MGKFGTVVNVSVVRAQQGWICDDCRKGIRAGKPAIKMGKTLCLGCAEKQGYRSPHIPFEIEPDYVVSEVGSAVVCLDCDQEIPPKTTCFFRKDGEDEGTYSCENCGVTKRRYPRPQKGGQKKVALSSDPLKASKQAAKQGA